MSFMFELRMNLRRLNNPQFERCKEFLFDEIARRETNYKNTKVMK